MNASKKQIIIPLAAILLLALFNLIMDPTFFVITQKTNALGNPVFQGPLISIIDNGSELAILAIGMTLVTAATGGQDISVGAVIAAGGSAMVKVLAGGAMSVDKVENPIILAFLVCVITTVGLSLFNGLLVAYLKIQPMIATLILFTAGRSIAAWINHNNLININDPAFGQFGSFIPGIPIPTPFLLAVLCFILIFVFTKLTNISLYSQSVGINGRSSRLNGLNPEGVKLLSFVILGICVAVAALIKSARVNQIVYAGIAKDIEMDAILAVALGGNALGGGRYNMTASILGAYVIQFLTTTLYRYNVPSTALPAFKAVAVIILVIISSPAVRRKFESIKMKKQAAAASKEVAE